MGSTSCPLAAYYRRSSTTAEKSTTPAMIKHGLYIQRRAIEWLNPGQIPVTSDAPI